VYPTKACRARERGRGEKKDWGKGEKGSGTPGGVKLVAGAGSKKPCTGGGGVPEAQGTEKRNPERKRERGERLDLGKENV